LAVTIKKLEAANLDQVSRFRMHEQEDQPLQIFIRRDARKSAQANLTQTYVAKEEGERRIKGYISLMCAEIKLEKTYEIPDKIGADKYEYHPAVRIARLAVESGHAGTGLGRQLVETAIGVVLLSIMPNVGCRFVVLDAKPKSIGFYRHLGFRLLETEDNKTAATPLMFMDLKNLLDQHAA